MNNAYNGVCWACLVSLAPKREKGSTIEHGYRKWGTHAWVFSQTLAHAWEQQEWNKTMRQTKTVKSEAWVWKKSKAGTKERSPDRISLPNQNTIFINMKGYYLFYKIWKKYNEIQLTKSTWIIKKLQLIHPPPFLLSTSFKLLRHCFVCV